MAVSSEAIVSAVKIAATAQRRRSRGKPSPAAGRGGFAAILSVDIPEVLFRPGGEARRRRPACTTGTGPPTVALLHDAYACAMAGISADFRLPSSPLTDPLGCPQGGHNKKVSPAGEEKRLERTG